MSVPGQIYLDGNYYNTEGLSERAPVQTFSSQDTALSGALITTQVQYADTAVAFVRPTRTYTLVLTQAEKDALAQTVTHLGALDLLDHTGFGWWVGAGTDDAHNAYLTGCYFVQGYQYNPVPQQANGEVPCNTWKADIQLVLNTTGLAGGGDA